MDIKQAIATVIDHRDLSTEEMVLVMRQIMTGQATDAQIAAFLVGLRMKSESIDEITGAAQVMRELVSPVEIEVENLVDTCGTGGDGANIFNVSTAAAFVVAAAGGHVAKHGNRSVSGKSGSADLLEAAGIQLELTSEQIARAVEHVGLGFMFAPLHHGAMKYAIGPRKEMGVRTLFNMLGPMTNPAKVTRQVIGVFSKPLAKHMASVMKRLGSEHVMVVHSADGLDEISIANQTYVAELKNGEVEEYTIKPEDFGINSQSLIGLEVAGPEESYALIQDALGKQKGPNAGKAADIIALNAGAAIYVSGLADYLAEGVKDAQDAIYSGLAKEKMAELASFTRYATQKDDE
ncbi:anthranilate phosphoribosyltransferase [Spartinivicinus ruber]|uniref:anthranilate phosphoribosyltransferase n=1 Tax=Spartinivicinus ruber TaxID=2683272 RepID=UPI0013D7F361|nr:anthranilate phosphoribosyltransferase [Spartinivicinus ruber]